MPPEPRASRRRADDDLELLGGAEHRPILLVGHRPSWAADHAHHAGVVRQALGSRALRVEHIGSTAVPGLVAKPVVDMVLVVPDPTDEPAWLPDLEQAGYVLRVREPRQDRHRMLRTPARDVHLHVYPPWSGEVERYLLLRDLLRADPRARQRYAALKQRLAAQDWPTMDDYARAKTDVIEELIAVARGA